MQVSVTFRQVEPTTALKEFAAEKVARIERLLQAASDAHVVLSIEKYMHKADITIKAQNGLLVRGHEKTEDMYASIDGAMAKIERQARRYRNRWTSHNAREGHEAKIVLNVLAADEQPANADVDTVAAQAPPALAQIIERKEVAAPRLTVEDAIMQMNLLHNDFLVFVNHSTSTINVLYRRREGNYGLIETPPNP